VDKDKEFLQWIYDRLRHIHHEPAGVDYMKRLQAIIDTFDEANNERTD